MSTEFISICIWLLNTLVSHCQIRSITIWQQEWCRRLLLWGEEAPRRQPARDLLELSFLIRSQFPDVPCIRLTFLDVFVGMSIPSFKQQNKQDARGPAGYFPPQISSKKTTGQQICSLLTLFNIPIYEVCRKFDKNCIKNFENWKILGFLSFSVSI